MAQRAYIRKSADRLSGTALIFTITDFEWLAWYLFIERDQKFADAYYFEDDVQGRQDEQYLRAFGYRAQSLSFKPRTPRRVDEFAATRFGPAGGPGPYTECQVASAYMRSDALLALNIAILLATSTERFQLVVTSYGRQERPARHERGFVTLLEVERYSAANMADTGRFKYSMLPHRWHWQK
jgi:hypothetical protein